jgi:hypothetical protein
MWYSGVSIIIVVWKAGDAQRAVHAFSGSARLWAL